MDELNKKSILELLELKEQYRVKYGLYIENDMNERGASNHKTKPYWTCVFKKRVPHSTNKGMNTIATRVYQTFDSYKESLFFCLERAEQVNNDIDNEYNQKRE